MGSWPAAMTHAVHPHHQLVLLRYNRNSCDLCGGPLVGKLGYRCEPCDFDVHCTCLPSTAAGTNLTRRSSAQAPPPPHVTSPWHAPGPGAQPQHHHYAAQPSVIYATPPPPAAAVATGRPQLNLSLSEQFSHQLGAKTSPVSPAPSNDGYFHQRPPRPDYGSAPYPHSYDHLQQQNYHDTNNQQGGYAVPDQQSFDYLQQRNYPTAYQHDYTATRDSGDADDYYDPLDGMND